ncbi:FAD-dependent pyridine nucleotide-disulfide oxidoreductase [Ruminiclostridium papyrosolvens DSM 2782]|uniref:FAD-dependent pyridine nucleotide-disulfide oxidoreductase n=1 Tax=Ruminiclostridium papyrosolvens DSM 2782 TaxID=588581 RepID=F1TGB2_9FIRM|nr:FAD-dependent oxidoreductase [Ruminiclostridium papyrosolvens]EGD46477.1 FAD-dependent pyridine nucleotide-disulfide oxidoreductase [Ruminiclostridium papyrosolvens DSM 2782]WES35208.1 FAD-dependent oxidoreductase [Ruminiclostridium papyrosolvens DSM 2782]
MKIVVIGCTHAGTAAITNMVKLYPGSEITVYEKNDNISFLSCGIALYVGGVVKEPESLFYSSPEKLSDMGITTHMRHEVTDIDMDKKILWVKNIETGSSFTDNYDKLVISSGSWPIIPKIEGIELEGVLPAKNYNHSKEIVSKEKTAQSIVVVGAGYIGVELAEAFAVNGKKVTLIDTEKRILSKYFDKEFTDIAEEKMKAKGITLALGETVTNFMGSRNKIQKVKTDKAEYDADLAILCIGFRPSTGLFKDKLEMLPNGAIIVDEYMQTSRKDVFAAGDCCASIYNPLGTSKYIPLATNAVRMGTLAALNLEKPTVKYLGTQGTSAIKIYNLNYASTGLTQSAAEFEKLDVKYITIRENYRPEFMPDYEEVLLKVVFDTRKREILGAQILSKADLTQSANTLSLAIQKKLTIDELAFTDFFFQPHYNKPWNYLNTAGLQAKDI